MQTYDDYLGDCHDSDDGNDVHGLGVGGVVVDFDDDSWLIGAFGPSAAYMPLDRCCSCDWLDICPEDLCIQWLMRRIDD